MKLNELDFKGDGQQDFAQMLSKAGYVSIDGDAGHFSKVYYRDGDPYALKIFVDTDHSYKRFLDFAFNHAGNPHLPKFKHKRFIKLNYNYCAVRVEILEPFTCHDRELIHALHMVTDAQVRKHLGNPVLSANIELPDHIKNGDRTATRYLKCAEDIMENYSSMVGLINDMNRDLFVDGYTSDIKNDNLMERGNTLVLIDPVRYQG